MLLVVFQVGQERYGLEAARVVEVAPLAVWKQVPHAPAGLAGLLNYRGTVLPVVDLSEILGAGPVRMRLSTRLIVTRVGPAPQLLALVAERVTETVAVRETELQAAGVAIPGAPYLGRVLNTREGMIQQIDPVAILTPELREALAACGAPTGGA